MLAVFAPIGLPDRSGTLFIKSSLSYPLYPVFVALLTVLYYGVSSSIAGYSVNPARSFASALFAWVWRGIWIYFVAPVLGMLTSSNDLRQDHGTE